MTEENYICKCRFCNNLIRVIMRYDENNFCEYLREAKIVEKGNFMIKHNCCKEIIDLVYCDIVGKITEENINKIKELETIRYNFS